MQSPLAMDDPTSEPNNSTAKKGNWEDSVGMTTSSNIHNKIHQHNQQSHGTSLAMFICPVRRMPQPAKIERKL